MEKIPEFKSVFAPELKDYLDYKVRCNFKAKSFFDFARKFDSFCVSRSMAKTVFTKSDADEWIKRREGEGSTTYYRRVNALKLFLAYLAARGYDVCTITDVRFKPSNFKPHIYTDDEVRRYFKAVDAFSSAYPKDAIQYPVLFRIMYCCGTRVDETLSIQKRDIDLEKGVIRLRMTKGGKERFVAFGEDLKTLLVTFADKCFYELKDTDYVFTSGHGNKIDYKALHDNHRTFLKEAGIPFIGGGQGPRIHDWRYHMAIYSFKQMSDAGMDMYTALPILSTFLGHESISATEGYLRQALQLFPEIDRKMKDKLETIFGEKFGKKDDEEH